MKRSLRNFLRRSQAFGLLLLSVVPAAVVVLDFGLKVCGLPGLDDITYIAVSVTGITCGAFWLALTDAA